MTNKKRSQIQSLKTSNSYRLTLACSTVDVKPILEGGQIQPKKWLGSTFDEHSIIRGTRWVDV